MLSLGGIDNSQFITGLYHDLLHREPDAAGFSSWLRLLDRGMPRVRLSTDFLISGEYTRAHPDVTSYVRGLYQDVLGRAPDAQGESFWEGLLNRHRADRATVALDFLASPESPITAQLGTSAPQGQILGVNVTPGLFSSAVSGNTAQVGINYNFGDFRARTVTLQVTGAGTYVLDHSTTFNILNNTGTAWTGYRFAILPGSTARPAFVSSSDLSGQLPNVALTGASITYSGGTVPSSISTPFLPRTILTTTGAGTIVLQELPVA